MSDIQTRAEFILEATDMADLVADILGPSRRGMWCCPFHDDRRPSMSVRGQRFHCFTCGERGRAIDFLQKHQGMRFMDALEYLEQRAGINPSLIGDSVKREIKRRKSEAQEKRERENRKWLELCRARENLREGIKKAEGIMRAPVARRYMAAAYDRITEIENEMARYYESGEA